MDLASDRGRNDLVIDDQLAPQPPATDREPEVPPRGRPAIVRRSIVGVVFAAASVVLVLIVSRQWFYYDEWDYLDTNVSGHDKSFGTWLFVPHNEHIVVWVKLWFQAVFHVVGLNDYWIYGLPLVIAHVTAAYAGYVIARRLGGSSLLALAASITFLFMGVGGENLVWASQFCFIFPVTLFLGWLALDISGRLPTHYVRLVALAVVWSVVGSLSSLTWLPLALVLGGMVATTRRWWLAAALAVPPVLTEVLNRHWFPNPGSAHYAATSVGEYLSLIGGYVWEGLTHPFTSTLHNMPIGTALCIAALASPLVFRRNVAQFTIAVTLVVAPVIFLMIAGYARIKLGSGQAGAGRYGYVVVACLLPLATAALARLLRVPLRWPSASQQTRRLVVVGFSLALLVLGLLSAARLRTYAQTTAARDHGARLVVEAAANQLPGLAARVSELGQPEPTWAPQLNADTLLAWVDEGRFNPPPVGGLAATQAAANLGWPVVALARTAGSHTDCVRVNGPGSRSIPNTVTLTTHGDITLALRAAGPVPKPAQATIRALRFLGHYKLVRLAGPFPPVALAVSPGGWVDICAGG